MVYAKSLYPALSSFGLCAAIRTQGLSQSVPGYASTLLA